LIVYGIWRQNELKYIGLTKHRLLCIRWAQHVHAARSGKQTPISHAIRKYGVDEFRIEPLYSPLSKEAMYDGEKLLIAQHDTIRNGYNCSPGGESGEHRNRRVGAENHNSRLTEEFVAKLRDPFTSHVVTADFMDEAPGVSLASLNRARSGKSWKHLNEKYPPLNPGYGKRTSARKLIQAHINLAKARPVLKRIRAEQRADHG